VVSLVLNGISKSPASLGLCTNERRIHACMNFFLLNRGRESLAIQNIQVRYKYYHLCTITLHVTLTWRRYTRPEIRSYYLYQASPWWTTKPKYSL